MLNWAKQQMANVVGTQEPYHGPSAVHSVAEQAKTTPYTELKKDDVKWVAMDATSVETQTFYLLADSGHLAFVQVIYSSVAGIRTTCQWNTKIFYPKSENKPILWSSDPLTGLDISEDKLSFYADNCAIELSEDGNSYAVKSLTNEKSIINVNITRVAPGFQVGTDGYTHFGTDPKAPWGSMRHAFWPRCTCEGTIVTADGPIDFKGKAMFIHALQGMKPHHLAARWNFANFQGPEYTAVMMEFTTPPSYGSTIVNVGGIIKGNEILYAGATNSAKHTKFKEDPENAWPEPEAARFEWKGTTKDGKAIEAVLEGPLETRLDRIDIMAEVPYFVKKIIANAAGTKPYIYQYYPTDSTPTLNLKIGDESITEKGVLFSEATFISEIDKPAGEAAAASSSS